MLRGAELSGAIEEEEQVNWCILLGSYEVARSTLFLLSFFKHIENAITELLILFSQILPSRYLIY